VHGTTVVGTWLVKHVLLASGGGFDFRGYHCLLAERNETKNGIKVLAAAYVALNHGGEGSSPSDPT
jgi:hypothetical protein